MPEWIRTGSRVQSPDQQYATGTMGKQPIGVYAPELSKIRKKIATNRLARQRASAPKRGMKKDYR
jgi:hypothetical protein